MSEDRRWRALLERSRDVITVIDESGGIRYQNRAIERLFGYAPDELVGENAFERVHPDDREAVTAAFDRVRTTADAQRVEHRFQTADGGWRWLESVASEEPDIDDGRYVIASRDIHDRQRAEAAVRERERRLSQIAENTRDVLWLFDADWSELLFVNSRVEDVYGISPADAKADPNRFLETVHPDDRERVTAGIDRLLDGEAVDMEYRVNAEEGYSRWVWAQGSPVHDADGRLISIAGFSRDVTERKASQRQLAAQNEQLTLLNRIVRHEIRNDVSIILGWIGELYEVVSAERREHLTRLVEAGEHVIEVTHALEAFTKAIDDDRPMRVHDVALLETLQSAVDRADEAFPHATFLGPRVDDVVWTGARHGGPTARASEPQEDAETGSTDDVSDRRPGEGGSGSETGAGIRDGSTSPDREIMVRGGPLLSVAFRNLLNNAVQHNEGTPRVEVSVVGRPEGAVVRIADDGPGLPTTNTDRLLGRDEWGLDDDGTGVGLHMVDLVTRAYGGTVRFDADAAPGTTVEIELRDAGAGDDGELSVTVGDHADYRVTGPDDSDE